MAIPGFVILMVIVALFAYGEYKEWRGQQQGAAIEQLKRVPLIEQEVKRERQYWLQYLQAYRVPQPQSVVLNLGDDMEIRRKAQPRLPKEPK